MDRSQSEGAQSTTEKKDEKRRKALFGGVFHFGGKHEKGSIEEEEYVKEMKRRMKLREKSEKAERTRSFSEVPSEKFKTMSNSVGDVNPQGEKNYSFYAERVEDLPGDIMERFFSTNLVCFLLITLLDLNL